MDINFIPGQELDANDLNAAFASKMDTENVTISHDADVVTAGIKASGTNVGSGTAEIISVTGDQYYHSIALNYDISNTSTGWTAQNTNTMAFNAWSGNFIFRDSSNTNPTSNNLLHLSPSGITSHLPITTTAAATVQNMTITNAPPNGNSSNWAPTTAWCYSNFIPLTGGSVNCPNLTLGGSANTFFSLGTSLTSTNISSGQGSILTWNRIDGAETEIVNSYPTAGYAFSGFSFYSLQAGQTMNNTSTGNRIFRINGYGHLIMKSVTFASLPAAGDSPGHMLFISDAYSTANSNKTKGIPAWWNGSSWVDALGNAISHA